MYISIKFCLYLAIIYIEELFYIKVIIKKIILNYIHSILYIVD